MTTVGKIVQLTTAKNPMAARLIERYQLTQEMIDHARNGRKWTKAQYQDYLKSEHWKQQRRMILDRYGNKCMLCSVPQSELNNALEIHHNDYTRLGGELITDCLPLCSDCHGRHHGKDKRSLSY